MPHQIRGVLLSVVLGGMPKTHPLDILLCQERLLLHAISSAFDNPLSMKPLLAYYDETWEESALRALSHIEKPVTRETVWLWRVNNIMHDIRKSRPCLITKAILGRLTSMTLPR